MCNSLFLAIALLLLAPKAIASPSILDVVKSSSEHQLLASFVEQNNLGAYLASSSNSATLFAPTDNDFAALPTPYSFYLHKQWYLHLQILLEFHVVTTALTESQIFAKNTSFQTLAVNDTLPADPSNKTINGDATIVKADIQASNGYVQIPSKVLIPKGLTHRVTDWFFYLDQVKFNYIISIFKYASSNSGIGTALYADNEPGITLFVPPNAAFLVVPEQVLGTFFNDTTSAYNIAGYQVAPILIYPDTYFHHPVAIDMVIGYTAWLYSDANNVTRINEATVIATNYATNGAVNEIDVLLQPLPTAGFLNLTTAVGAFAFTTFLEYFDKAGLTEYFNVDVRHPLTFFVPVDAAFTNVQTTVTRYQSQSVWVRHWRSLLLHHVTNGALKTNELPAGTRSIDRQMLSNYTITIGIDAYQNVSINNAPALLSDMSATNGVIHALDQVLLPPSVSSSIYQQVSQFATLNSLIKVAGLVNALDTSEGPITLLAPNDEAFAKVGNLANYSNDEIHQILMNHVFAANIYVSDLAQSQATPNLISKAYTVKVSGNNTYVGGALILNEDNLASNGVFQVIDRVLVGSVKATGASPAATAASQSGYSAATSIYRGGLSLIILSCMASLLLSLR